MSDTVYVTPAQVLAAKLLLELREEDGEAPSDALKAVANAQPEADVGSAHTQQTDAIKAVDLAEAIAGARELLERLTHVEQGAVSAHHVEVAQVTADKGAGVGDVERTPYENLDAPIGDPVPTQPEPPTSNEPPRLPGAQGQRPTNPWTAARQEPGDETQAAPPPAIDPPNEIKPPGHRRSPGQQGHGGRG
jgi:hypothetical protein